MNSEQYAEKRLQQFFVRILLIMAISVVVISIAATVGILSRATTVMKRNTATLLTANGTQLKDNVNSYIDKVESTAALIFSDEIYYNYDATDETIPEYDRIQYQNAISDRIVDLAIMDSYGDFGIVYANDKTVGWISNSTKATYEDTSIYEELSKHITNERTNEGWFLADNEELDKLYYVKRVNDNAVIASSIYSTELARVFEMPKELKGVSIRLIDDDMRILYSSDKNEVGYFVPEIFRDVIRDEHRVLFTTDQYIVDVNTCKNGWRILCTMSLSDALLDIRELELFAVSFCILIASVFLILVALAFRKLSNPMGGMVQELQDKAERDGLSGLLNKISFEQHFDREREKLSKGDELAFMIMDVDHFKTINDTLGHAYGDQVIVRTSKVLVESMGAYGTIGRIGGDEFAVFFNLKTMIGNNKRDEIISLIEKLSEEFLKTFSEEHEKYELSLSIGLYYGQADEQVFQEIYRKADSALYKSKKAGRNRYTIYEEAEE